MVMPATSAVAARSEVRNIRLATFCEVREFCLLAVSWSGLNRSFKPGGRVERLSAATQFDIKLGSALRSVNHGAHRLAGLQPLSDHNVHMGKAGQHRMIAAAVLDDQYLAVGPDRKSTRLNSSHSQISYAVFCLKKKRRKYNS